MHLLVIMIVRVAEEAAYLALCRVLVLRHLVLRHLCHLVVVAGPCRRSELLVGGINGIDVPVDLLVDLEELLSVGQGEAAGLSGHLVGRQDGEGRLVLGGRQDDATGIARPGRSIGRGDPTTRGKGVGNDQVDLVGMADRGDAQTADADVALLALGLLGGACHVGRFAKLDGLFVVEAFVSALGFAGLAGKTAVGLVISEDDGGGGGGRQKSHEDGEELHDVVAAVVATSIMAYMRA